MILHIYTDGACRGNPGQAGVSAVIMDESGNILQKYSRYIGITTNNVAEYTALVEALNISLSYNPHYVYLYLDSELVVKHIKGLYRVRDIKLKALYDQVMTFLRSLQYEITHIPREKNILADELAKEASYNKISNK